MPTVTVKELESELIDIVKTMPTFKEKAYSIFDLEELENIVEGQTQNLPLIGVGYNSGTPHGNSVDPAGGPARTAAGAAMGELRFVIVVAMQYGMQGQDKGKQHDATALLGEIRSKVIGFKGKNTRPWRWMGERPEPEASGDGIIFYSQWWETTVPIIGAQT